MTFKEFKELCDSYDTCRNAGDSISTDKHMQDMAHRIAINAMDVLRGVNTVLGLPVEIDPRLPPGTVGIRQAKIDNPSYTLGTWLKREQPEPEADLLDTYYSGESIIYRMVAAAILAPLDDQRDE